jgi:hypothetical protein
MLTRIARAVIILLCVSLTVCFTALGQGSTGPGTSPDKTLTSLVQRLKATKDPLVILDYVHWPTAFKNMPDHERQAIKINSADELKGYFQRLFQNPDSMLNDQISSKFPGMSDDKRKELQETAVRMAAVMKDQRQRMQERLAKTEYQIGKVEAAGDNATVELISMLDGQTKISKVKLEKVGNAWYLPSVRFVQEQKGTGEDR